MIRLTTANINKKTKIAFGYISANALDAEVVTDLLFGEQAKNLTEAEALEEYIEEALRDNEPFDEDSFYQNYEGYEDTIEGEYENVFYISSWLGGALNFFIVESPFITQKAAEGSMCVPNCGILDSLEGETESYNVPESWRWKDEEKNEH